MTIKYDIEHASIYDLAELVDGITPENKHDFSETDFGEPVGREKL